MALIWNVCFQFASQYKHILADTDQYIQVHTGYIYKYILDTYSNTYPGSEIGL